jgi:hypothetical protein
MTREYVVHGESLVSVKGAVFDDLSELGLAEDFIRITPMLFHEDMFVDDFGLHVPADVLISMYYALVKMVLIHYDQDILDTCIAACQGSLTAGVCGFSGTPLFAAGFGIRLNIKCMNERPYRFYQAYLMDNVDIPIGAKRTAAELTWCCLPLSVDSEFVAKEGYIDEIVSPNSLIWDRTHDDSDNP